MLTANDAMKQQPIGRFRVESPCVWVVRSKTGLQSRSVSGRYG